MAGVHLNRQLLLERPARVPDGAGGFTQAWQAIGALWAEVDMRQGRERGGEAVPLTATACRITVRAARPGTPMRPVAGQRFREGARIFRIEAVAERDARGRYLTCFAREEAAL